MADMANSWATETSACGLSMSDAAIPVSARTTSTGKPCSAASAVIWQTL